MRKRWTRLDVVYTLGVALKGIDGAIEFFLGLLLLFDPGLASFALSAVAAEASESRTAVRQWIAAYVENLDDQVARAGVVFLVVFLTLHGLVKLVLAFCLLRGYHWVYPYALVVLTVFLGYQVYSLVTSPTVGMALLSVLDAIIILLIYREYRVLKSRAQSG